MRLKHKLQLLMLLTGLIPLVCVGGLSYQMNHDALAQEARTSLTTINHEKSDDLTRWLTNSSRQLEMLASLPAISQHLDRILHPCDQDQQESLCISDTLRTDFLLPGLQSEVFTELFILDPTDGTVLISSNTRQQGKVMAGRPFYQNGKTKTTIENIYYSLSIQKPTMVIATPLFSKEKELAGVLAGRLNLDDLSRIMSSSQSIGATENNYLVNAQHYFITEPLLGNNYALRKTVNTDGVHLALSGESGVKLYRDYRDTFVFGAYHHLDGYDLAMITEIDHDDFMAPIQKLRNNLLIASLIVIGIALLIGALAANVLFTPIGHLIEAINRIDSDNLDFTALKYSSPELRAVSEAFSSMTARLKTSLISRERLHKEVTQRRKTEAELKKTLLQLNRSNQELEQFAYVASHDLQEPLRMVASFTQLLAERYRGKLDDKADTFIHYAVDGAERMQILIQDLLSFSRLTTKGKPFEKVDMNVLLARLAHSLQQTLKDYDGELLLEDLPEIWGDEGQLTQLFQNLITNGLKFSSTKAPIVRVGGTEKDGKSSSG